MPINRVYTLSASTTPHVTVTFSTPSAPPLRPPNIIAPSALTFGRNVLDDISQGDGNIKSSLKKRGLEAVRDAGARLARGGGKRKKRKQKQTSGRSVKRKKKCYKGDVFSIV